MTTTRDRERLDTDAMKTQRMDNSVAPVTGASEGGGKVVARQLTAAGVTVYVRSRDARREQAAVDEIGGDARLLVLVLVLVVDVTGPPASPTPRASSAPGTSWLTTRASRLTASCRIQRASRLPPSA
jgi:NAD(P)-dependent dehydrogenase (short-subunit alcohol dehydrogenase family)